jgi:hypothetical protein
VLEQRSWLVITGVVHADRVLAWTLRASTDRCDIRQSHVGPRRPCSRVDAFSRAQDRSFKPASCEHRGRALPTTVTDARDFERAPHQTRILEQRSWLVLTGVVHDRRTSVSPTWDRADRVLALTRRPMGIRQSHVGPRRSCSHLDASAPAPTDGTSVSPTWDRADRVLAWTRPCEHRPSRPASGEAPKARSGSGRCGPASSPHNGHGRADSERAPHEAKVTRAAIMAVLAASFTMAGHPSVPRGTAPTVFSP